MATFLTFTPHHFAHRATVQGPKTPRIKPTLNQRELSKSLGVIRWGQLLPERPDCEGFDQDQNFRNNHNKWVYAYLMTPQGLAEKAALTSSFLKRKMQEYHQLKAEIEVLSREVNITKVDSRALQVDGDLGEVGTAIDGSSVGGMSDETLGHGIGHKRP